VIDLFFADGVYTFKLGLAQINEIETKCGSGLGAIFARLLRGRYGVVGQETFGAAAEADWKICDLIEPIRQGLIGGNKAVVDGIEVKLTGARINELVANYVLAPGKLDEAWTLSVAILTACIQGYEPPKKAEPVAPAPRKPRKKKVSSESTDTQEP